MDDQNAGAKRDVRDLECRPPVEADVVALCRELNQRGARYVVVGGFAIIAAGLPRLTADVNGTGMDFRPSLPCRAFLRQGNGASAGGAVYLKR